MDVNVAPSTHRAFSRLRRWLLAGLGVVCVGLGAVGVFVPGLPTTVFLIMASWLFARSCPWLEERLLRVRLFEPFLTYLRPGTRMPRRAVVTTLVVMWSAIALSATLLLTTGGQRPLVAAVVVAAGLVGTAFVLRLARPQGAGDAATLPVPHELNGKAGSLGEVAAWHAGGGAFELGSSAAQRKLDRAPHEEVLPKVVLENQLNHGARITDVEKHVGRHVEQRCDLDQRAEGKIMAAEREELATDDASQEIGVLRQALR